MNKKIIVLTILGITSLALGFKTYNLINDNNAVVMETVDADAVVDDFDEKEYYSNKLEEENWKNLDFNTLNFNMPDTYKECSFASLGISADLYDAYTAGVGILGRRLPILFVVTAKDISNAFNFDYTDNESMIKYFTDRNSLKECDIDNDDLDFYKIDIDRVIESNKVLGFRESDIDFSLDASDFYLVVDSADNCYVTGFINYNGMIQDKGLKFVKVYYPEEEDIDLFLNTLEYKDI